MRAIHPYAVELDDGRTLAADLVVLGVGVRPRTALAEKAGLKVADGIIVDSFLRTSAPGIWAAGDVARYPELRLGTTVRIEHWVVAERHGQAVARDMLGLGAPFHDVPFFWSQHYDVTLSYVGHASSEADHRGHGQSPEARCHRGLSARWACRGGRDDRSRPAEPCDRGSARAQR